MECRQRKSRDYGGRETFGISWDFKANLWDEGERAKIMMNLLDMLLCGNRYTKKVKEVIDRINHMKELDRETLGPEKLFEMVPHYSVEEVSPADQSVSD